MDNSDITEDMLTTEMDNIKKLRVYINNALKQLDYEIKHKITYKNNNGCDNEKIRRVFKIYYAFNKLKKKEKLKVPVYTALFILWDNITQEDKKKFLDDSKNPNLCHNFSKVPETFETLNLISKWVKLNSLTDNKKLSYLIYTLDVETEPEGTNTNMSLLPKINEKIKEINKILATLPQNINLLDLLYDLIVLFHQLNDNTNKKDSFMTGIVYGPNYYRNIYSAILLFWKFIETNVHNIENHPKYRSIVMNMEVLSKTYKQNKTMNKISRKTLKGLINVIPKKKENVEKLRHANLIQLV